MRTLILIFTFTLSSFLLHAQDTWNDYVIGRPMAGHYDAKKAIAKEWGINYQAIFAGCILSDEISDKANAYKKSNKVYFKVLAAKHGEDWKQKFELDVKKELYRNNNNEKGIWFEVADENKNKAFYTVKKVIAKTWGISYETQFLSKNMTASEKTALAERFLSSQEYLIQLEGTFGQNWQETLNKEVNFELKKKDIAKPDNTWTEYVFGRPNIAYFDAKKVVAKKWDINYEVYFKNCSPEKTTEIEAKNALYFKLLEKHHGKDWKLRFEEAVQKELTKN